MELDKFAEIVENMALQHDYPGYDIRSLKMGLPLELTKSPAKLFNNALKHPNNLVKLAALRWFQERPGVAKRYTGAIADKMDDPDPWVKAEAALCLERIGIQDYQLSMRMAKLLRDSSALVRKSAAKALGKLGSNDQSIIEALQKLTEDRDQEVRFKAQKALRQLGVYIA